MKIAILVERYFPHVKTCWAQSLAEGLARRGIEPRVLTLSPEGDDQRRVHGVDVTYIGVDAARLAWTTEVGAEHEPVDPRSPLALGPATDRVAMDQVQEQLERWRPALVQTCDVTGLGLMASKRLAAMGPPICHMVLDHSLYAPCDPAQGCAPGAEPEVGCATTHPRCVAHTALTAKLSELADALVARNATLLAAHLWRGYFARARLIRVIGCCPGLQQGELAAQLGGLYERVISRGRCLPSRGVHRSQAARPMLEDPTLVRMLEMR